MASAAKPDPDWAWPQDLPGRWTDDGPPQRAASPTPIFAVPTRPPWSQEPESEPLPEHRQRQQQQQQQQQREPHQHQHQHQHQQAPHHPNQHRSYPPRTCRICLETVQPTFAPPASSISGVFQSSPSVTYESDDGGRLVRPCLCKGSQKYVHEACLTAWRMQDPTEKRNYWQCPTCRYSYRLERMTWARWISSTTSQIFLTFLIFLVATFVLGYVADPIINLYLDPYGTLSSVPSHRTSALLPEDEPITWIEHFVKGLASLGLLGFAKFLLTLSPIHWFNMRTSGAIPGGRPGTAGRDRMQQISWIAVLVGVATVVWAVWKGVRAWSRKTLESFSEKVMDVPGADDDDDED
ncbi:hypothetical protein MBLNU459_g6391t1 [Dothideomycetes sp. NU459]